MDSISPWVGVGSLALALISAVVAFAFWAGRLSERVDELRRDEDSAGRLALQFVAFKATMEAEMKAQTEKIDGLVRDLVWLRQTALPEKLTAARRRA